MQIVDQVNCPNYILEDNLLMNTFLRNIQNIIFHANNYTYTKYNIIITIPKNFLSNKKPEINQSPVIISKLRYMNKDFHNWDAITNKFMQ